MNISQKDNIITKSPKQSTYTPTPKPIRYLGTDLCADVLFDNRFARVDDIQNDSEHIHDCYEIYINLSGDVSFLVDDETYSVKRGDIIITRPNEIHKCIYHTDCIHEHYCLWFKNMPRNTELLNTLNCRKLTFDDEEIRDKIIGCFQSYYLATKDENQSPFGAIKSIFELFEIMSSIDNVSQDAKNLPKSFSEIVDYISAHFTESDLTVSTLCEKFYISKSTLYRRFKKHFLLSPAHYIEAKRLSLSKQLLSQGMSVQDACINSGFSDCSYFILRFKNKFNITPYKYQQSEV
ncbi:MAG: helix-turn-helix transcriptional regulator [Clostridia bacterium]|nr:helix-turn-helix transcriptional regulator [Clostridia bacterium]